MNVEVTCHSNSIDVTFPSIVFGGAQEQVAKNLKIYLYAVIDVLVKLLSVIKFLALFIRMFSSPVASVLRLKLMTAN